MMTRILAAGVPMLGLVCLLGCTGKPEGEPAPEPVSAPAPAPAPGPGEPMLHAPALEAFTLKLACELHGTGISRDTIDVTTSPGAIRFAAEGQAGRVASLSASELQPLGAVLASPGFATFVAETPTPGTPHPGMTYCTLDVQSDMLKVDGKRWMTEDTFTPEADAARRGLHRELAALQRKLPAPAPAG